MIAKIFHEQLLVRRRIVSLELVPSFVTWYEICETVSSAIQLAVERTSFAKEAGFTIIYKIVCNTLIILVYELCMCGYFKGQFLAFIIISCLLLQHRVANIKSEFYKFHIYTLRIIEIFIHR